MIPIFDGHNDTLLNLVSPLLDKKWDFLSKNEVGHIDLIRAREGGLYGGIFSINVPNQRNLHEDNSPPVIRFTNNGYEMDLVPQIDHEYAKNYTDKILQRLSNLVKKSNGNLHIIKHFHTLKTDFTQKLLSIILHFEGAEMIRKDLQNLEVYYKKGLRALGPVWSRPNAFGYGVPFKFPHTSDIGPGLTSNGKKLVQKCNELGIIVDLAHLNMKGFIDVVKLSTDPLVVSHTGVYNLCRATRNITDKQIDMIGDSNGIIGIYFDPINLLLKSMPDKNMSLSVIIDHIEYIVQRIGIDHVGFGSDFDGADMPNKIRDASSFPNLIQALKEKGYTKSSIEKIAYKNWFRILKTTWRNN
ncbi:MAG: Membrane dipeptidase [Promethearchaeota archaeon]|nr:MAG: Membrane dipeptidase [Candidatus Lokiarchaeota archaeon]